MAILYKDGNLQQIQLPKNKHVRETPIFYVLSFSYILCFVFFIFHLGSSTLTYGGKTSVILFKVFTDYDFQKTYPLVGSYVPYFMGGVRRSYCCYI